MGLQSYVPQVDELPEIAFEVRDGWEAQVASFDDLPDLPLPGDLYWLTQPDGSRTRGRVSVADYATRQVVLYPSPPPS